MRIVCPHCGERDLQEFAYGGDAGGIRPNGVESEEDAMFAYVYLRDNPAGQHREFWYHSAGCHAWLIATRDTRTHAIVAVEQARESSLRRQRGQTR
jgi:heterotetrameric sarcosine oxidase delta subunit